MRRGKIIFFFLFMVFTGTSFAQVDSVTAGAAKSSVKDISDTTKTPFFSDMWSHDPHSPTRAAIYSAVIPGLGQAYNGKYWKIPIVYAGIGTSGYFIYYWNSFYKDLRDAYIIRTDGDSLTIDTQYDYIVSDETLLQYVDATKRYNDLLWIVTGAVYILNIVDAVVDAHLYDFDVSDDLTMHLEPYFIPKMHVGNLSTRSVGLNLTFTLR